MTATFTEMPSACPACGRGIRLMDDVSGLAIVYYECGLRLSKSPEAGAHWRIIASCQHAQDTAIELFHARQWAATWKRAAKCWHGLAYETHLTTADDMTHDAAIAARDNCYTEHSRALLRVGALEGLLRQVRETSTGLVAWALGRAYWYKDKHWVGRAEEMQVLLSDIDAALAGEGETK